MLMDVEQQGLLFVADENEDSLFPHQMVLASL
jgi:hypothetical protein